MRERILLAVVAMAVALGVAGWYLTSDYAIEREVEIQGGVALHDTGVPVEPPVLGEATVSLSCPALIGGDGQGRFTADGAVIDPRMPPVVQTPGGDGLPVQRASDLCADTRPERWFAGLGIVAVGAVAAVALLAPPVMARRRREVPEPDVVVSGPAAARGSDTP